MAQNYEVFLADRPLLICCDIVDNSALNIALFCWWNKPEDWAEILEEVDSLDAEGTVLVSALDCRKAWDSLKDQFKVLQAAGGLVLDEKKRMLAIYRLGKWDLPKGKLEKGEDVEECARREVEEECGLNDVQLGNFLHRTWHTYIHKNKRILKRTDWFLMSASSNQTLVPQAEEDIEQAIWMDQRDLKPFRANTYNSILRVLDSAFNHPKP